MSHETKSKLMKLCRKAYGRPLEIIDATEKLRIQPMPCDATGADPKSPDNCVFARSGKRMYSCKIPTVFKSYAYFDLLGTDGKVRLVRHASTKAITDALREFDRGAPFPVGKAFIFLPIPEHKKLENIRIDKKRWREGPRGKAFQEVGNAARHLTTAKRQAEQAQEQYVEVKREMPPQSPRVKEAKMRATSAEADVTAANERLRKAEARKAKVTVSRGAGSRHPKARTFDPSTRNGAVGNYNFVTL